MRHGTRNLATVLVTVLAMAATTGPAVSEGGVREPAPDGLQEHLDALVAAGGGAVGALARVRDETGAWRGTTGKTGVDSRRPVAAHGHFRAGSITKTFVATVILQLVHERRLRLDDPVEAWLPGVVPDGHRVTVRHLLNHTSGLHDYLHTLPMPPSQEFYENRWRTWPATELIDRALAHPPTFEPPGSAFAYSNTNYLLLGELIREVTGRRHDEEIERRIIRPLRLRGTSVPGTSPHLPEPYPHGYVPKLRDGQTELLDYSRMNPSVLGASGDLISTTRDLNRFFAALLDGRLVPGGLLDEMKTPGIDGGRYGLGLAWRDTTCGLRVFGNDGDTLTYQSWSFSTGDLRRQVTLALTPDFAGDVDAEVDALLDEAICGRDRVRRPG